MTSFRHQFLSRCEDFLTTHRLLTPNSHVILAVSGGIDSMTMLQLFTELQNRWKLTLSVVQVNHQLRGVEANEDEAFVQKSAETFRLQFYATRFDTLAYAHDHSIGKQQAARELRYQFFEQVRHEIKADLVATAHNADDNAETVLMNALRGSGIHGLAGIPVRRETGHIIRPLLFAYREEIERYAKEVGVAFRQDSSNDSLEYKRNLVRHKLMPLLKSSLQSDIAQSLNRISTIMRELEGTLSTETESVLHNVVRQSSSQTIIEIPLLLKQSPLIQDEIILTVFRQLNIEPHAQKVLDVLELCFGQTGRSLSLSRSVTVYRDRDRLVFGEPVYSMPFEFTVEIGKSYQFSTFEFIATMEQRTPRQFNTTGLTEFVDAECLGKKLTLRNWKEGDWFIPLGLHAKKKLSDFFTDVKVPIFEKHRIPVLESDGNIVWVCGYRLDERFMVTKKTASVVKLQYVPTSGFHY